MDFARLDAGLGIVLSVLLPFGAIVFRTSSRLGSTLFVVSLMEEDEKLTNQPMPTHDQLDLVDDCIPKLESDSRLSGLLHTRDAMDEAQRQELMKFLTPQTFWLLSCYEWWQCSTR